MNREPLNFNQKDATAMQQSDGILVLAEGKKGGLIVCKTDYAEFVGPGAAVFSPVETEDNALIAIGSPEYRWVNSQSARQRAYNIRIQWMRWLQKITESSKNPIKRSEKLLSSLEGFWDAAIVWQLPDEALAKLIGVMPRTMNTVRQQQHLARNPGSGSDWQPLTLRAIATYQLDGTRARRYGDENVQVSREELSCSA